MSRRSLTYETRLHKYGLRGFSIAVPGLLKEHIDTIRLAGKFFYIKLLISYNFIILYFFGIFL